MRRTAAFLISLLVSVTVMNARTYGTDGISEATEVSDSIREVVVTGTRCASDIRHLSQTVNIVSRDIIKQSRNASPLPVLTEQVPGLFVTSRGVLGYGVSGGSAGEISLRGISGGSSRLLVLIDGHPHYAGIFGHPVADAYKSSSTERVEVLRGPASLLYGSNAMGGVVNIVSRKQLEDGVVTDARLGYGLYNTVETSISNSFKKKKFSSFVSGTFDRTDGHRSNMDFMQYGGVVRLGYDITSNWKISGDIDVSHFDASQPGPDYAPLYDAWQSVTRGVTSLYVENKYERTSGAINVSYSWGHHRINDGHTENAAPKDYRFVSDDDMLGVSAYQSAELFKGNRTTAGLDFFRYGGYAYNDFVEGSKSGTKAVQVDRHEYEVAGYIDFRQQLGELVTLNAGSRIDWHSTFGTEWVPQFGATFHLPFQISLKAVVSKGFRNPTIRESYMFATRNPHLRSESMWNYEIALSQKAIQERLVYGVNFFLIDAKNIILALPDPSGAAMKYVNSGALLNTGVEAQISYQINGCWSVNANYSFLYMKNPVPAAPEHKLYAGGRFSKGIWNVSTGIQYINGLYTSVTPVRKENYFLWNVRFSVRPLKWLEVWINGENLTNSRYQIINGYPMPGTTFIAGVDFSF